MAAIVHGKVYTLSKRVRRITAPNPGVMTGDGTNTYLVGVNEVAVVDPGPAEPSHIEAILKACEGTLRWILVTHTHPDHSPAAQRLAEVTGAKILGNKLVENDGFQDDSFSPQQCFNHNDCLQGDQFTLRALCTPGHVDNHVCFLLEEEGLLITGDHIMQGSTVVIIPPHGDMKSYIQSLQLLLDYPLKSLAPGHGHLIESPIEEINGLVAHRLKREAKVVDVLRQLKRASLDELTPKVYDDVDPGLHTMASFSLLAHLIKLQKEAIAEQQDECWCYMKS